MKYCNHSSESYGTFKHALEELTMCAVWVLGLKLGSSRYTSTTVRAPSENVISRWSNCSFIIPSRLAGKTFANLLIYIELALGTPRKGHVRSLIR